MSDTHKHNDLHTDRTAVAWVFFLKEGEYVSNNWLLSNIKCACIRMVIQWKEEWNGEMASVVGERISVWGGGWLDL
jgi:hypothetical protein